MSNDTQSRMRALAAEIEHHDILYYCKATPAITDRAYDALLEELRQLETLNPQLASPNSPTRRVGSDLVGGFEKVAHTEPMLSLENTYNLEEAQDQLRAIWDQTQQATPLIFAVEPKIDGVAVACRYKNGELVQAITRGDGAFGDDITANVRAIRNLPLHISTTAELEFRGEIYMPFEQFELLNQRLEEAGEDLMANPRNAAAGTIKAKDPGKVRDRGLEIVFHGLTASEADLFEDYDHFLRVLAKDKLPVLQFDQHVMIAHPGACDSACQTLEHILQGYDKGRHGFPYPTDGCVIKLTNFDQRRICGETNKAPRWAYAFKFEPEAAQTLLKSITLQVGRTGAITPVAELEPVQLAGTTVSRATLHNFEEVERKDIRAGDIVEVVKAGEIIPAVTRTVVDRSKVFNTPTIAPTYCPSCSSVLVKDGANLYCRNDSCAAKNQQRFEHFASRDAMNIQHLGPAQIRKLLELGLVREFEDFYRLTAAQLLTVPGFREASVDRLLDEINRSRQRGPEYLLYAWGIPHVGRTASKAILKHFGGDLERVFRDATVGSLTAIEGIGDVIASSLLAFIASKDPGGHLAPSYSWFQSEDIPAGPYLYVRGWANLGVTVFKAPVEEKAGGSLAGETWVITGTLSMERVDFQKILEDHGARVTGSVSAKTTHLLVGAEAGKSKLTKATNLGITLVSEAELHARLGT
jgi:DNA ligase (NAD+)